MSTEPLNLASFASPQSTAQIEGSPYWGLTFCLFLTDALTLALVFGGAVLGRHLLTESYHLKSYFDLLPFMLLMLGGLWVQGLYPGVLLHPADEMRRIFLALTTVFLVMTCTTFLWRTVNDYSRSVFLLSWAAGTPLLILTRHLLRLSLSHKPWWGVPALVIGSGGTCLRVLRLLKSKRRGVRVIGVLTDENPTDWPQDLPPILGSTTMGPALAASGVAQYVIVATSPTTNQGLRSLISDCCFGFGHVLLVPDMPGLCSMGVSARDLGGEIGLELPQRLFHRGSAAFKRILDLLISVVALLVLSPLFLLITILVMESSGGNILYKHKRYGRHGKTFAALKFRTMVPNADQVLADHLARHPEDNLEWQRDHKLKNDPRVTRVGKWLRQLSLDELLQLVNVLKGEMSLVGPRPIVFAEIEKYGRGYALYSRVLPGITGLWQVSGRNNTTYDERVAFDEFYVSNWSVWLDAYILVRTIRVVLTADGAY